MKKRLIAAAAPLFQLRPMASFAAEQNPGRSCERYTPANRFHPEMW